jgi:predicted ATPase
VGVFTLYGEPGVGKSRLLHEAHQQLLARHPLTWLVCPADGLVAPALHPFQRLAQDYFDQRPDRSAAQNKAHFDTIWRSLVEFLQALAAPAAASLAAELERTHSFLGALAGDLHWPDSLYARTEPKLRLVNTRIALCTLLRAESLRQPVIVQLEDWQWFDADSREVVRDLTRQSAPYPLALLVASRYAADGRAVPVPLDDGVPQTVLDLNHLSPAGTVALLNQLVGQPVAAEVGAWLVVKTNGNPFSLNS